MIRFAFVCAVLALLVAPACKKKEGEKPKEPAKSAAPAAAATPTTPAAAPTTAPSAVKAQTATSPEVKPGDVTRCPVSDETFTVEAQSSFSMHKGKKVYFCCDKCKKPFERNPEKYLKTS
jgi:xanthine dehydrogenase accessory factor